MATVSDSHPPPCASLVACVKWPRRIAFVTHFTLRLEINTTGESRAQKMLKAGKGDRVQLKLGKDKCIQVRCTDNASAAALDPARRGMRVQSD